MAIREQRSFEFPSAMVDKFASMFGVKTLQIIVSSGRKKKEKWHCMLRSRIGLREHSIEEWSSGREKRRSVNRFNGKNDQKPSKLSNLEGRIKKDLQV